MERLMPKAFYLGFLASSFLCACGGGSASIKPGAMPDGGHYTGVYFSPQYGEMHLIQNGSAVAGEFKKDERTGKMAGEVEGDVMAFEWTEFKAMVSNRPTETKGRGYFRYVVDPNSGDHVLRGRWGLGDEDSTGGEWNAYKSKSREPEVGFASGGGEDTDDVDLGTDSLDEDDGEEGDDIF